MLKKHLSNFSSTKILITGGAGFIGSHIVETLVKKHRITVYDNFRRNALQYLSKDFTQRINVIEGDVLNEKLIDSAIKGKEIVFHLAAIAGVSSYEKNPLLTLEVDAFGTYYVLKACAKHNIKQVFILSSSEVYGAEAQNITEDDVTCQGAATESRWSYSTGKLLGDHFAFAFSKVKKVNITILRPFNIYGPRQVGESAMQIFIHQALSNLPITINGNGKQTRAWCHVNDFLQGLTKCLLNSKAYNQIFNIGNPDELINITQLARQIKTFTHSNSPIIYVKQKGAEVHRRSPNITKAKQILDFKPKISISEGLASTIDWYKRIYEKN